MANSNQFDEWAQNRFQGLTKAQLKEAGEILGVTFGPNTSEASMQDKLLTALGSLPATGVSVPAAKPAFAKPIRGKSPFDPKPNLTANGAWGGLVHRCIVSRPGQDSDTPRTHLSVKWDGVPRWWGYDREIHMPEPHYHIVKNATKIEITEEEVFRGSTLVDVKKNEHQIKRYNVQDLGILPGTESLPKGGADYWTRQCEKTNGFTAEGVTRQHLMQIRTELFGPPEVEGGSRAFYKDLTNEDILADIYSFLNYDEFAEAA